MHIPFWLLPAVLLYGCMSAPPPAAPAPVAAPPPQAPPPIVALPDWRAAPLTPGGWRYQPDAQAPAAIFGEGLFLLRCDYATRLISFGGTGVAFPATVSTSYGDAVLAARVSVTDNRLDGIAFSRGRFAVASPGRTRLILPAWPEIGRVIEDCRR